MRDQNEKLKLPILKTSKSSSFRCRRLAGRMCAGLGRQLNYNGIRSRGFRERDMPERIDQPRRRRSAKGAAEKRTRIGRVKWVQQCVTLAEAGSELSSGRRRLVRPDLNLPTTNDWSKFAKIKKIKKKNKKKPANSVRLWKLLMERKKTENCLTQSDL